MKKINIISAILTLLLLFGIIRNTNSEPRNLLIEYCTGTWCGWCPCGHQALNSIKALYPQTISLAYHGGSTSADPWKNFNGVEVRSLLGFTGYPTGIFDRTNTPSNPYVTYDMWMTRASDRYLNAPNANVILNITSKIYNPTDNSLNVTVTATPVNNLEGQYKISFVLIENNLIYQQNHYSQCGTSGYVQEYIHNHVVRSMLNGPTGELLNSGGYWNINQIITTPLNTTLDPTWVADNCKIVVFAYKDSTVLAYGTVQQAIEESVTGVTGISGNTEAPGNYALSQNYPNPFNPVTNIRFDILKSSYVSLSVMDITGKVVEILINQNLSPGTYNYDWDAEKYSSGVYFYKLETDGFSETKKMVLIK